MSLSWLVSSWQPHQSIHLFIYPTYWYIGVSLRLVHPYWCFGPCDIHRSQPSDHLWVFVSQNALRIKTLPSSYRLRVFLKTLRMLRLLSCLISQQHLVYLPQISSLVQGHVELGSQTLLKLHLSFRRESYRFWLEAWHIGVLHRCTVSHWADTWCVYARWVAEIQRAPHMVSLRRRHSGAEL